MEIKTVIEKIGLSKKQTDIYLALLELGEATITDIARTATMKRPTTYLIINELEMLGLVSSIKKGKKKIYSPAHPRRLAELTKFRMDQVEDAMPELIARYKEDTSKPKIEMYEGIEGVRKAYREVFSLLQEKKECLWISDISMVLEKQPDVLKEYSRLIRDIKDPHIREFLLAVKQAKNGLKKQKRLPKRITRLNIWEKKEQLEKSINVLLATK